MIALIPDDKKSHQTGAGIGINKKSIEMKKDDVQAVNVAGVNMLKLFSNKPTQ